MDIPAYLAAGARPQNAAIGLAWCPYGELLLKETSTKLTPRASTLEVRPDMLHAQHSWAKLNG